MKVKLTTKMKNMANGKAFRQTTAEDSPEADLRFVAISCLLAEDPQAQGAVKYERARLAKVLLDGKAEVELKAEEVSMIKEVVGRACASPALIHAAWQALEGNS